MMTEPNCDSVSESASTLEEISPEQTKENFWDKV